MSSYMVGVIDKKDLETYQLYIAGGYVAVQGFEAEVSIAERPEVLEGTFPGTTMIIMKFKNKGDAKRFYHSESFRCVMHRPKRHSPLPSKRMTNPLQSDMSREARRRPE